MVKLLYKIMFYYFIIIIFISVCLVTITPVYGSTLLTDYTSRHNLNDSYFSSFYLFWTTFFYLPEFFFIILFFTSYSVMTNNENVFLKWVLMLILFNLVYVTELFEFIPINYVSDITVLLDSSSNVLLLNMLNRYHPFIFYVSVTWFVYLVQTFVFRDCVFLPYQSLNLKILNVKHLNVAVFTLNFIALWLGGWWAFQEGTWGGWWNSDISEMLGLIVMLVAGIFFHSFIFSKNTHSLHFFLHTSFLSFSLLYYFIQINYELTSHNFGARFFFFFNNNLLLLELMFFLLSTLINAFNQRFKLSVSISYVYTEDAGVFKYFKRLWMILQPILFTGFLVWITLSLLPLIDIFTQHYVHITDINLNVMYLISKTVFTLLLSSIIFRTTVSSISSLVLLSCYFPYIVISSVPYYIKEGGVVRYVHIFVWSFLILNICSSNMTFLYWGYNSGYVDFYTAREVWAFYFSTIICDSDNFNTTFTMTDARNYSVGTWTTVTTFSNSSEVDHFSLVFDSNILFNYFYFVTDWAKTFILIESVDTSVLNVVLLFAVLLVRMHSVRANYVALHPAILY